MSVQTDKSFVDALQIGRAYAALAVALQHTIRDADRYYPRFTSMDPQFTADSQSWIELLAAGVDVFFVISGVVMVLSTQNKNQSIGRFLYRRAARIFPLWWTLTLIYIVMLLLLPQLFNVSYFEPVHATCSMLLIPCTGPGGEAIPLIYAGWTLTYELVFYALFAISLLASTNRLRLLLCIALVLLWHSLHYTSLATVPAVFHSSGNLMFEFLYGVLLGSWFLKIRFLPRWGLPAVLLGVLLLLLSQSPTLVDLPRFLNWGLPALCIVFGLMCLNIERSKQTVLFRFLVFLGAASYSLYLFHFFALRLYFVGMGKLHLLAQIPPVAGIIGGCIFALITSVLVYQYGERWLTRMVNRIGLFNTGKNMREEFKPALQPGLPEATGK